MLTPGGALENVMSSTHTSPQPNSAVPSYVAAESSAAIDPSKDSDELATLINGAVKRRGYEEKYSEEDVISPTSAFREVMVSTHTSNFGYGNEYGNGALGGGVEGTLGGEEQVKLNGTSLVMDTSEENSIRGGGKEREVRKSAVTPRMAELRKEGEKGKEKKARYRPAYELVDGSLERCGRGTVPMAAPGVGRK
jgi:hypothetical protein